MPRVAIQGGAGSFNEEAFFVHGAVSPVISQPTEVVYALTSERTLSMVLSGLAQFGQFAIQSSFAGPMEETIQAKERHNFDRTCRSLATYALKFELFILSHPDVSLGEITKVLTHPTAISQCVDKLTHLLPHAIVEAGTGDLIDPATVGGLIARGEVPRSVATLSSSRLAERVGLKILTEGMQDAGPSETTFELFTRAS